MIQISPSILSCDFGHFADELQNMKESGAELVHIDVMDGQFVENISFGVPILKAAKRLSDLPMDVHLMINNPEKQIEAFAKAGADIITFHVEASENPREVLDLIHGHNIGASISMRPATPVEDIFPLLDACDMVLIMTVEPGKGGQKLLPETLVKISKLRAEIKRRGLSTVIEADGGINAETASSVISAGADILVAGSAVFGKPNMREAIDALKHRII